MKDSLLRLIRRMKPAGEPQSTLREPLLREIKYLSLRTLFLRWLLVFSLLPLIIIVIFFTQQFKSAVQEEIFERLIIYTKQVQDVFNDYEEYSKSRINEVAEDNTILFQLKTSSVEALRESFEKVIEQEVPTSYVVYDQTGHLVLRVSSRDDTQKGPTALSNKAIDALAQNDTYTNALYFTDARDVYLNLNVVKRIKDDKLNWEGYLEKTIIVDEEILRQIKSNLGLDIIFFGPKGNVFITSLPNEQFTQEQMSKDFLRGNNHFFDVSVQGQNFGFISTAVNWGDQQFLIAIGASKETLTRSLSKMMYLLLVAFFVLVVCLLVFSYVFTNQVIQPITQLMQGVQNMQESGEAVQIENKSRTEIGVLTDNFNAMSLALHEYRKDLENKIQDLEKANLEVQSSQSQLLQSAKLASLGQLVAGVAHELNNPIGFVYSNMQHLREYTGAMTSIIQELGKKADNFEKVKQKYDYDFISKDLAKLISSCEEGARRTRDIVIGLRNFSRASDKDQKKFSVTDCIDSTVELLSGVHKNTKVTLEKKYDSFVPLMTGNPNQMSQVFMNILANAYQATGESGVIKITVTYNDSQKQILVKIADTGSGIAKENLDKIFDPFFTTKDVGQGTGLGLSISYGIVQSHGGDIHVDSQVGQGTTFTLNFPVSN